MRKQMKRLTLSKETLRSLDGRELANVAGQTNPNSCVLCSVSICDGNSDCTVCHSACGNHTCPGHTC